MILTNTICRRFVAISLALALGLSLSAGNSAPAAAAQKVHPAVKYMQRVASELMAAQRSGRAAGFAAVIARHADVQSIAMYSLGRYSAGLAKSKRGAYYRGVREFMARYFAAQSRQYRVVKSQIGADARVDGDKVTVHTKVWLASGSTYNVNWQLIKRRGRYRINDVSVLGFSLAFLQRGIFYRFLNKKNGDVNALVAALNR